jgi:hypothetical protein
MAQKRKKGKRKVVRRSSSVSASSTPSSKASALYLLKEELQVIFRQLKAVRAKHVNSHSLKEKIIVFVRTYFSGVRVEFLQGGLDVGSLDADMQELLAYSNARTALSVYKKMVPLIQSGFHSLEVQQMALMSNKMVEARVAAAGQALSDQDKKIIGTLSKILPSTAISYQQVIADISNNRISYKGSIAELREVLREVLDYLAPDKDVLATPGFKLEKDRSGPTMKQKVRFILKSRKKTASAIDAPENAAALVEEGIAKLARATYDRGSLSAHTTAGKEEAVSIKRYLDSVLCELLEIY